MSQRDDDFREKMLHLHGEAWVLEQESAHAAKFPPKVTAEDVWEEFKNATTPPVTGPLRRSVSVVSLPLCQHIADLRNAAREDDEAWIEDAVQRIDREIEPGWLSMRTSRDAIRNAYRARRKA